MRIHPLVHRLSVLAALLLVPGCLTENSGGGSGGGAGGGGGTPQPVDHAGATGTATSNLRVNVEEFEEAFDFVEASQLFDELADLFPAEEIDEDVGAPRPEQPGDPGHEPPPPDDPPEGQGEVVDEELDVDFGEILDEALEVLQERLLVEEQVEVDADNEVVYLLDPERICEEDEGDAPEPRPAPPEGDGGGEAGDPPPPVEEEGDDSEEECRRVLTEVPLRIRVTSLREGDVDLTLLVGEPRHEPLRVELHADLLAVQVDLAAGKAALELLAEAAQDEDDEELDLPDSMAGVVRAELLKNAARDYTASLSILEAVVVEDGGDEPVTVRLGMAKPMVSLRLDGNAETATGRLAVGTVDVSIPYQWFVDDWYSDDGDCMRGDGGGGDPGDPGDPGPPDGEEPPPPHDDGWEDDCEGEGEEPPDVQGTLRVHVAGLTGESTFSGEQDRIEVTGVGLGPDTSTVSLDAKTLAALDLNADHGRVFDWALALDDADNVRLEVTPAFDLSLMMALRHVADDLGEDDLPPFALDETLSVTLDGAATPALESVGDGDDRQLQVAEGRLTLASTAAADDVVVEAGQCIGELDEEEVDEDAHELLGHLEARACRE